MVPAESVREIAEATTGKDSFSTVRFIAILHSTFGEGADLENFHVQSHRARQ